MDKARRIYERRLAHIVGAGASLASLAGVSTLAAARYLNAIDLSYGAITAIFGATMLVSPTVGFVTRRFARRRIGARVEKEIEKHPAVPAGLIASFAATREAKALESASVSLPLAHRAALGSLGWLWLLGLSSGSDLDIVGKALGYAAANGALSIVALGAAAYLGGRWFVGDRPLPTLRRVLGTSVVLLGSFIAGLARIFSANDGAVAALSYFAVGGIAVMLPSVWKATQRMRIERASLAAHTLLAPSTDIAAENERLVQTIRWLEGPPEVRAEALRALTSRLTPSERGAHLDQALDSQNEVLRRAALDLSQKLRHTPSLERLLALANDGHLPAEDAARLPSLLHRHRDPEVQTALMRLLRHPHERVAEAAAISLGLVGSASSVVALRNAGRVGGLLFNACQEAIERIQIRLSQSPGQLSLVDASESGALSPADEGGSLTFPR